MHGKPKKVKNPTLVITSEDDPLFNKDFIDVNELIEKNNENLAFVLTKEGRHVSFCEGLNCMGKSRCEEFYNLV